MLAERLSRIVNDILKEYDNLRVTELLSDAAALAGGRANIQNAEYSQLAQEIRARALAIQEQSRIRNLYSNELRDFILESEYASALPENLASTLITGFPNNKAGGSSSPELKNLFRYRKRVFGQFTLCSNCARTVQGRSD